jgi:hypothetical protein
MPGYLGELVGKNQESIVPNRTDPLTACMGGEDPLKTPFRDYLLCGGKDRNALICRG